MPNQAHSIAIERAVHTFDAKGATLGRLATRAALVLRGKHKVNFELNKDCGDYVVIENAKDIVVTGNKLEQKMYYSHTGFPGGLHEMQLRTLMEKAPEKVIERAIYGMLPKNKLRSLWMRRLTIHAGEKVAGR